MVDTVNGLFDFDVNKMLGISEVLPANMITDPNYQSNQDIAGLFGGAGQVISAINEGAYTPEVILRGLGGIKAGREGEIAKQLKNYMTRQDIMNQNLAIQKLQGDIAKQPYEIGEAKNKWFQSSFKTRGLQDSYNYLEKTDPDLLMQFQTNPDKFWELYNAGDPRFQKYSQGEMNAAQLLGLDPQRRDEWTPQQIDDFDEIISAPSPKEAAEINAKAMADHKANPNRVPYIHTRSRNEVIADIRRRDKGMTTTNGNGKVVDAGYTRTEKSNLPVGQFRPTKDFPEGGFKGSDGKLYTPEQWNEMGIEQQNILSEDIDYADYQERKKELYGQMRTDKDSAKYAFHNMDRTSDYLEKILSDPKKFKSLFTWDGRLAIQVNKSTGAFFATESKAQDIVNLLNTIKGQNFVNEIQLMRQNNKTGGAVGNVSDREVAMFQDMAANLNWSGSADQLWSELNDLYERGHKMNQTYVDSFKEYYGEKEFNRYNMGSLSRDKKIFNRSLEGAEVLNKQLEFNEKMKGFNGSTISSGGFTLLNP